VYVAVLGRGGNCVGFVWIGRMLLCGVSVDFVCGQCGFCVGSSFNFLCGVGCGKHWTLFDTAMSQTLKIIEPPHFEGDRGIVVQGEQDQEFETYYVISTS
jgi:hypothetical protein